MYVRMYVYTMYVYYAYMYINAFMHTPTYIVLKLCLFAYALTGE